MKSTQMITVGIASMLMIVPMIVGAEGTAGNASGGAQANVSGGVTVEATSAIDVRESGAKGIITPRDPASGLPTGKRQYQPVIIRKEIDKTSPLLGREVTSPRDSASGQSTGRMMASGTKPLPPKMEEHMEMRDRVMASGSPIKGERAEMMKERMQERRGEILKRMATQMVIKMQAAIERFTKIADRIDSRIAKMKAKGIDTGAAEAKIIVARAKIAEATATLTLAEGQIASASIAANATTTNGTSIDAGKSVREALQKARAAIEAAHKALVEAIVSLRAKDKIEVEATTSAAVNQ